MGPIDDLLKARAGADAGQRGAARIRLYEAGVAPELVCQVLCRT